MSHGGLEIAGSDPRLRARSPHRDGSLAGRLGRAPPPRQICRCRRRFRTTATSETGAPSIGSSQTLRPGRACCACCSRAQIAPHPVVRCEPGAASSKAAGSPRAIPRHPRTASRRSASSGEKDAPHRLLQPTSFTSTLRTAVFPAAPPRRSPPCGGSRRFERRLTLGHGRAASRSWGDLSVRVPGEPAGWSPCLTAKLQLQPSPQPSREPPKGCLWRARELCPEHPREGHDAVLVEPRSETLPRPACRPRCSRP
jgi:hypothetical protein